MRDTSRRNLSVILALCSVFAMYKGLLIYNNSQKLSYSSFVCEDDLDDLDFDKKAKYNGRKIKLTRVNRERFC